MIVVTPAQFENGYYEVLNPYKWNYEQNEVVYIEREWVLLAELEDGNYLVEEQRR